MYRHTSGWFIQPWISGMSLSSTGRSETSLPWIMRRLGSVPSPVTDQFEVDVPDTSGGGIPGEPAGVLHRTYGEPLRQVGLAQHRDDPLREGRRVVAIHQEAAHAVINGVPEPANPGRQHWGAARLRFEGHQTERLGARWDQ